MQRRPILLSRLWLVFGMVPFGLWLFGALPVAPPAWSYSDLPADVTEEQAVWGRRLFCLTLTIISSFPWIWIDTFRFGGARVVRSLWRLLGLQLRSKRVKLTALVMLSQAGVTIWMAVSAPALPNPYFLHLNVTILAGAFAAALRPPVAIALMPSRRESGPFLEQVSRGLNPLRTVALVDGGRVGPVMMFGRDDNLRTSDRTDWRALVRALMDHVPLIIVDARDRSEVVAEEVDWILQSPDRTNRALAVVSDQNRSPILDQPGRQILRRIPLAYVAGAAWRVLLRR